MHPYCIELLYIAIHFQITLHCGVALCHQLCSLFSWCYVHNTIVGGIVCFPFSVSPPVHLPVQHAVEGFPGEVIDRAMEFPLLRSASGETRALILHASSRAGVPDRRISWARSGQLHLLTSFAFIPTKKPVSLL